MNAIPHLKRVLGCRFKSTSLTSSDHRILGFRGGNVPQTSAGSVLEKKKIVENLWREFLADPLDWWDHRSEKLNPRFPDFKHRATGQALWLIDDLNPPWVEVELAALSPAALKSSIFTWNIKLARLVKAREYDKAIDLFRQLQIEGMEPDVFTFASVLDACSALGDLEEGRNVHLQIKQTGYKSDVVLDTCLVNMYAKCGKIEDARRVFDRMTTRDVVAWSAMILGYVQCKEGWKALRLYKRMQKHGVRPDPICFVGLVNACASVGSLDEGRRVHEQILQSDHESDIYLDNSLVDMYAKCGSIEDAWSVFNNMNKRDIVTWNAMILGYAKSGEGLKALDLYRQMRQEGVEPNPITFVGVLNSCSSSLSLEEGRSVHQQIILRGCESNFFVSSSLVDMYAKCGSIVDARRIFDKMATRNVVAWSAIILGYANDGKGDEALKLSRQMQQEGVKPNAATFVGILNACASLAALKEGRKVHKQITESCHDSDIFVGSSLVDMYAKCGSLDEARRVFETMPKHDVVSWSAMIKGYGMHGNANEALRYFEWMCEAGVKINAVTVGSLLSACSHGGLVDEGLCLFESISAVHSVILAVEHYACIVDLLGRAGRLHEAEYLIETLFCEPNASVLLSLLSACRLHGNVEMAKQAANQVVEFYPKNSASYALLSNTYAGSGNWDTRGHAKQGVRTAED